MKKTQRISEFVARLGTHPDSDLDPRYTGFFQCFNEQQYYEAHDVLEDLWLEGRGPNYCYFKGLIQVAGAFVHLQKQHLRPEHPKDGRRARPASRLFQLAADNLAAYRPTHLRLDVEGLWNFCLQMKQQIEASDFTHNPWDPSAPLQLLLIGGRSTAPS